MATTPTPPVHPQAQQAQRPAPPQPSPAPAAPPSTEEKKPEEKVVAKEEVRALFEAGTKLKKKGDPPEKWIAATRLHNTLCLAQPLDEEMEKKVLGQELVIVPD